MQKKQEETGALSGSEDTNTLRGIPWRSFTLTAFLTLGVLGAVSFESEWPVLAEDWDSRMRRETWRWDECERHDSRHFQVFGVAGDVEVHINTTSTVAGIASAG